MTNGQILDTLKQILREALLVSPETTTPDSAIFEELGAESLDVLDIRFRMEKAFEIKIDQDAMVEALNFWAGQENQESVLRVRHLVEYVRHRL